MSYIEENLYKELGLLLRSAREAAGLTLSAVANRMNVTTMTIQRYEKGERKISIEKIRLLCEVYSVSADDLMAFAITKAHSTANEISIVSKSDTDSPTGAIVNMIREESLETQMRVFDVVCDFLSCNEYNQGRIASYANMLAAKGVDTSSADREVDKIKADFYAKYDIAAETPSLYGVDPEDIDTMTGRPIVDEIKRVQREAMEKSAPAKKQVK